MIAQRAEATALDAAPPDARGPLHGVPTAIKDLTMTAGVRTTFGSAAFADFVPSVAADVVSYLRAAGTVSLGKTTTSELGTSCHAESLVAPPARNLSHIVLSGIIKVPFFILKTKLLPLPFQPRLRVGPVFTTLG